MLSAMAHRHRVRGVRICFELLVFNLLGCISRDGGHFGEDGVTVHSCDNSVDDEVASAVGKVQHNQVTGAGAVVGPHSSGFLHDGGFGHSRVLYNAAQGLDEAVVHEVSGSSIWASGNMALKGFRGTSR
jgi:hypothetical protein